MFVVSLSVATTIVLVIAVTLLMAETLNQLVVFHQLQVPVVYHVLHAVYLGIQAAPFVSFILVAFRIIQRWIIELKVSLGMKVYDPAHPERNTPESFVEAGQPVSAADAGKE